LDLPVSTNGENATDMQFPVAFLAVFAIHFKLCTYLFILDNRTLINFTDTLHKQMSFSS